MQHTHDLVIRGAMMADGLGGALRRADVASSGGTISEVGTVTGTGREEIDAQGLLLTPGFVDIHTHYDGQAIWDQRFSPSSWHGVTTVVMGNCGVGFAPVRVADHNRLIDLMEGVEDIPGVALHEGLDWKWESFAQFLDALERKPHDIDFCAQLPHAALRVYVMGERATRLEPATREDCVRMRELAAEAMRAGALGFTTSRSLNHKTVAGVHTPTLKASADELVEISMGLRDAGRGVLQMICDFDSNVDEEFALMRRMAEASGRPLSFSLMQKHKNPDGWKRLLELTAQAVADGLEMRAQVAPRGVGVMLGFTGTRNVFTECPSYKKLATLPFEERIAVVGTPEMRATLLEEIRHVDHSVLGARLVEYENIFDFGDPPNYDPGSSSSVAAIAAREGREAAAVAYDLQMKNGGRGVLYSPFANYYQRNLDVCGEMLADPNTVVGLGDGGAHVGMVSDASFQTFMLSHWGNATGRFELPWLIKRQTSDTARAVGLRDRGVIAPGMKADFNLIEPDKLGIDLPHLQFDLPAGGKRLMQRSTGYVATIVSGEVVYREGEATGALPGRLVRGPTAAVPETT
jgi:N-acyl-D-aspartate/D-glutamate deacylase